VDDPIQLVVGLGEHWDREVVQQEESVGQGAVIVMPAWS
jgi:hypothetical protein